jgi:hypothetical protein
VITAPKRTNPIRSRFQRSNANHAADQPARYATARFINFSSLKAHSACPPVIRRPAAGDCRRVAGVL